MFKTLLIAGLAVGSASPVSAQADRPADATWPVHRIERARKPWTAQGRVTDAEGRPLAGVSVHASCGMGSLHNTGSCVSDRDGRYELSFGPGIWFAGDDHSGLQAAIISARSAGLFEENLNRQGGCVAASRRPSDEELKAYAASRDRCFVPGEPLTIDFVMRPAAKFSGRLVDERDQPLAGWSVSLTGAELPPASSVLASARADDDGRFVIEQIPTTVRFQVEVRRINPKTSVGRHVGQRRADIRTAGFWGSAGKVWAARAADRTIDRAGSRGRRAWTDGRGGRRQSRPVESGGARRQSRGSQQ